MADELELAASVRAALAGTGNIREVRMFGGIGFMLNGNLVAAACCSVSAKITSLRRLPNPAHGQW